MNHVTTVKGLGEKGAENSILTECFKAKDKRGKEGEALGVWD